ncbi:LysR family transcriptional regulator [Catenovulum agarivorans DS-2]|uniref:LysR family transcriptional regulator n=1 Tax=Catenovulum agarivorans DS-2 TaxID=1328313 RepID=W7QDR2_9ALTE|nr:hydrogen peroxide-inducible genes activator [Catenovulum agarivorans]EWH11044.1 LysR family transcriptional regulator [Catenovulum agarivorans DS-2]
MAKLPSIRNLQYLIKLYELKNFNRAAEACFVSQSTLSAGIQNLEEQLGGQLIERDQKSFVFTEMGEVMVEMAKQIVQQVSELTEIASEAQNPLAGRVKIGCIPTIAPFLFKDFYLNVQQSLPDLQLQLKEDTTENLLKSLDAGELDCLILALPVDIGAFHSKVVGDDKFWMAAHNDYPVDHTDKIDYAALPDHSIFLLQKEHCLTEHAVSACRLVDNRKINPFSATSLHTLMTMVECQAGATFVPQMAVNAGLLDGRDIKLVNPAQEAASRQIGLVWRQTTRRAVIFNKLSDILRELLMSIQE